MRKDAFDDVACPFNYDVELYKAREALKKKIGMYVSEKQGESYRELAPQFGISPAALCAIAKKYSRERKLGRPSGRDSRATFDVSHVINGKEYKTQVTVTAARERRVSVASMRHGLRTYFHTTDISRAKSVSTGRRAVYDYDELWKGR